MRDVASGQEVATGREEIAQPEDLPVCDEKHALVRPPGLHTQPASAVAQQGTLYKCQQALIVEQKVAQRVLKALVHKKDQVFGLRMWCGGCVLEHCILL